jgi:hypothetical protein
MMGISPTVGNNRPLLTPTVQTLPLANSSFGGPHPTVCQFVFVDASVKPVHVTADLLTLTYLVTRNDNQVITKEY